MWAGFRRTSQQNASVCQFPASASTNNYTSYPSSSPACEKAQLTIAVEAADEGSAVINKPLKDADLFATVEEAYNPAGRSSSSISWSACPTKRLTTSRPSSAFPIVSRRYGGPSTAKPAAHQCGGSVGSCPSRTRLSPGSPRASRVLRAGRAYYHRRETALRGRFLTFKFHEMEQSILEATMGRGDRRYGEIIETAWRLGARFDLWNDCFDYSLWQEAFARAGLNIETRGSKAF